MHIGCGLLGQNTPAKSKKQVSAASSHPDSIKSRFKRIFSFADEDVAGIPIVCFGPEGLGRNPEPV